MIGTRATVLFSGGQDSTTCLFWAEENFKEVDAVSINYGQRHLTELDAAREITEKLGVKHTVYDAPELKFFKSSALTNHQVSLDATNGAGLPTSFTPGRNDLLLTIAGIHAYEEAETHRWPNESALPIHLVTGVCMTDYSGYPDCRQEFINAKAISLGLALNRTIYIHAPLMWLTKAETILMMMDFMGPTQWALGRSVTCYKGERPGCGECPSCKLRAKGFDTVGVKDPAYD